MIRYYIGDDIPYYQNSEGALYRIGINLISAFIFLLIIRNRVDNIFDKRIYTILSFIAIVLFLVSFHASTFADRFNYYIFPLHLYTLTHFISLFKDRFSRILLSVMTICLYFGILNIWLFFGNTSSTWIPYKMFPFSYRVDSCLYNEHSCYDEKDSQRFICEEVPGSYDLCMWK